jgi:hypothetical protein
VIFRFDDDRRNIQKNEWLSHGSMTKNFKIFGLARSLSHSSVVTICREHLLTVSVRSYYDKNIMTLSNRVLYTESQRTCSWFYLLTVNVVYMLCVCEAGLRGRHLENVFSSLLLRSHRQYPTLRSTRRYYNCNCK